MLNCPWISGRVAKGKRVCLLCWGTITEKEIRSSPMFWLSIHMLPSPIRLSQYYNDSRTITSITGRISISFYWIPLLWDVVVLNLSVYLFNWQRDGFSTPDNDISGLKHRHRELFSCFSDEENGFRWRYHFQTFLFGFEIRRKSSVDLQPCVAWKLVIRPSFSSSKLR